MSDPIDNIGDSDWHWFASQGRKMPPFWRYFLIAEVILLYGGLGVCIVTAIVDALIS
jgi:hypothetical protein